MNIALVLSGGSGSRMKLNIPKQYVRVGERMVITFVLDTLISHKQIDAVQIVAAQEYMDEISGEISDSDAASVNKLRGFAPPGDTRQLSILNGLNRIKEYASEDDIVLVCDAARPMTSKELIAACIEACAEHDGAMPVLPMKDTVYLSLDGKSVSELLDRSRIFAGQAPEAYRFGRYLRANEALLPDRIKEINGSTEPAVLAGLDIAMIPGDEGNFKITTKADLKRFTEIVLQGDG